jgi:putative toxin-antitoxin system antitoxin component (TIGR02293 family)
MVAKIKTASRLQSEQHKLRSAVVKLLEESVETVAQIGKEQVIIAGSHVEAKTALVWVYLQAYTEERASNLRRELANLFEQQGLPTSLDEELKRKLLEIRNLLAHSHMKAAGSHMNAALSAVESVREGYRTRVGQVFSKILEMQSVDLLARLGIPKRTAERRLTQERFTAEESDRLYRAMNITRYAIEIFGDADTAAAWMKERNPALGGVAPLSLLDTDPGVLKVREVLTRIDYGVYS